MATAEGESNGLYSNGLQGSVGWLAIIIRRSSVAGFESRHVALNDLLLLSLSSCK